MIPTALLLVPLFAPFAEPAPDAQTLRAWAGQLAGADALTRREAANQLVKAGPRAKAAVPALRKLLADTAPEVRRAAAFALVAIDPAAATDAVPVLVAILKLPVAHDDPDDRIQAADALGELGPAAKAALPELAKLFDAKNPHVRIRAAAAAARIDPEQAPRAAGVLAAVLKDPKHKRNMVRSYALAALIRIGPGAKPAMPTLSDLLTDDGRFHGTVALAMVLTDADGAKAAYEWLRDDLRAADSEDDLLRTRLPELGERAAPLLPELRGLLTSADADARACGIRTLGTIGPRAKDALPALKGLAETDPEPANRTLAAAAVGKIEAK